MAICYQCSNRFTKFYILDLFTNNLVRVSEKEFDSLIIRYRNLFELEYDGANAQNFILDGRIQGRRER